MKDYFSIQSKGYAQFRPVYPLELYRFLLPLVKTKQIAWDCGTGNGQVAYELANHFHSVHATDISENQIANAAQAKNIFYKVEAGENTQYPDKTFDLITVAQAIHWFDFNSFFTQAKRVLKPEGIIALIGYNLPKIDPASDQLLSHFYNDITGPYWNKERKYIDENYKTIPFPFVEIPAPPFYINVVWNFEQMIGFLNTWSAVQHYIKAKATNPVDLVFEDLKYEWSNTAAKKLKFPILLRVGKMAE